MAIIKSLIKRTILELVDTEKTSHLIVTDRCPAEQYLMYNSSAVIVSLFSHSVMVRRWYHMKGTLITQFHIDMEVRKGHVKCVDIICISCHMAL